MFSANQFSGPVFVVGMPRSGTKLLRGLLNAHSKIGIPLNETEFLPYLDRHWPQFGDLSRRDRFESFYKWITATFYFQNRLKEHGEKIELSTWYLMCKDDFSLPNVFEQLIRHDANVDEGGVWGDKSPSYLGYLPVIKRLYPDAKIIHIIRDVRDYVLSMEKAFGKDRKRAAQRWVDTIYKAKNDMDSFQRDVLEVQYEDLLQDPSNVLREVCGFIGLSYEESMIHLEKSTENLGDTVGEIGIIAGNFGKYQHKMTDVERIEIERIAKDLLLELNYTCEYIGQVQRISSSQMFRLQCRDALNLIAKDARRNGWLYTIRSRVGHFVALRM
jgi:hypothetical protein